MSYPGLPPPGSNNGYWNGHDPPMAQTHGMPDARIQPAQHGNSSQYQNLPSDPSMGQYENSPSQYHSPNLLTPASGTNGSNPSSSAFPAIQQPQFVNPAQLFQQPPQSNYHPAQQASQVRQSLSSGSQSSVRMAPVNMPNTKLDQPMLLMSLAEEYFEAAHKLAPSISTSMTIINVEAYEKLIATGLACLDTALKHIRLPPRVEANMRLRYAGVLYEETENFMEAELTLSKGIALCERNHYFDLKYAMQFLLAQLMFEKNPRAAIKALDGHIADANAYQHYSWVYALRFLRAFQSLESGKLLDTHAAVANFRSIATVSDAQSEPDRAIYMTAYLMEAMAHLQSAGPESMEHAQQAIAQVWTYQEHPDAKIPQLLGLAHILDVACSLRLGNPQITVNKLRSMQTMMDQALKEKTWSTTSDTIAIPINRRKNSSQVVSPDTRMVLGIGDDGRDSLLMSFLNMKDAYNITYLLSGMVLLHKNSMDQKGFKYLETGLDSIEGEIRTCKASSGLLPDCLGKLRWRGQISCYLTAYMAFCAAAVADWPTVRTHINKLRATAKNLEVSLAGPLGTLALYLKGVYYQGTGDLDEALQVYQDKKFDLPQEAQASPNISSADQVELDISLLAALNTLWVLQDTERKDPSNNTTLIARLEPFCGNHPNKDIQTAFNLIVATVETNPPAQLFKIKNYLRLALEGAQYAANTQFLCITLNVMCSKFFSNVVGAQAEKSAMAASVQAKKSGNVLWRSVADGMLAQCYEVNGKKSEAESTLDKAQRLAQQALPNF